MIRLVLRALLLSGMSANGVPKIIIFRDYQSSLHFFFPVVILHPLNEVVNNYMVCDSIRLDIIIFSLPNSKY